MKNHIIVLGGDGFCGWPTALHLSMLGYDVTIVDNLSRRNIDNELGCSSLTPIATIQARVHAWWITTGRSIRFVNMDIAKDHGGLLNLLTPEVEAVVHFAEQRAAPYSMKSSKTKRYTVDNNINGTHNLLAAIAERGNDIHLVHLGTMGVYGYGTAGVSIPEGYIDVTVQTETGDHVPMNILYPSNPGSVYHLTKTLDQLLFAYYAKNDALRITDLHQGIVWGTQTPETRLAPELINRFDYDGDYGTVLNRFLMQAAVGVPMTVHGTGGQTRAFIHITDTVKCIAMAIKNPPQKGDRVVIRNQMTETHRLIDLANMIVQHVPGATIEHVENPRNEAAENELIVTNDKFIELGLEPTLLSVGLADEVVNIAGEYRDRADLTKIPCVSRWKQ